MRLPSPAYREYLEFVATALVTIAVLQYMGIFGRSEELDLTYLAVLGLSIPISTYFLTVALENISRVSQWQKMVRQKE